MPLPYWFAAIVGLTSLAFALVHALKRVKETKETISKAAARKQAQVDRIKRVARNTLNLAHEIREAKRRKTSLEMACEDLEQRLKASNAADRRLYVLDDRRTQADLGWVVRVANPDYAARVNANLDKFALDRWKRGRRFLVWALDEPKAREKVVARYTEHKGFYVQSVQRYEE